MGRPNTATTEPPEMRRVTRDCGCVSELSVFLLEVSAGLVAGSHGHSTSLGRYIRKSVELEMYESQ